MTGRAKKHKNKSIIRDYDSFRRHLFSKRGGLANSIPYVRYITPCEILEECIKPCLENSVFRAAFVKSPFPKELAKLKLHRPFPKVSPEFDFEWTSIILAHYLDELKGYVNLRDKFYKFIMLSHHEEATACLDQIEAAYGKSLWLISARISLLQSSGGVTAQKEYLEMVLGQGNLSIIVAMVAFYSSFAAEDNVSKSELDRELSQMISGLTLRELSDYFIYHAYPTALPESPHLTVVLEENSPIIDRFETFVEMLQLQLARSGSISNCLFIGKAIKRLSCIPDIRVQNLCYLFFQSDENLFSDGEFNRQCDNYTTGKYAEVLTVGTTRLSEEPYMAWWYDLVVRTRMKLGKLSPHVEADNRSLIANILNSLESQRGVSKDMADATYKLQKLMLLSRGMPAARYLAALDPIEPPMLLIDSPNDAQWIWIFSSPLTNAMHFRQLNGVAPEAAKAIFEKTKETPAAQITLSALKGEIPPSYIQLPPERRSQFEGHAYYIRGDALIALQHYKEFLNSVSEYERRNALILVYSALSTANMFSEMVSIFTKEYIAEPISARIAPLQELSAWISTNQNVDSNSIDASIVLHAYTQIYGSKYDGDLSDAYENFIDYNKVQRPSELFDKVISVPSDKLIYFIRHVCTIARMEDGTGFDDISAIERERVILLQWLIENDPQHSAIYISEIKGVTKDQAVASLSAHLERNKIYVNEEVVRRSFDAEMRYSFARYRELLIEPELETRAGAIEIKIKRLLRDAELELKDLKLPSTERDSLFQNMYYLALSEFLVYPNGGLKTYLSTRILHGALEGEMRLDFSRAKILFSREKELAIAEYDSAWRMRLEEMSPQSYLVARDAVVRFSGKFNESLLELIVEKVRIRLETTPNGLLAYEGGQRLTGSALAQMESIEKYEDFIDALFDDFWIQTESGLTRVKSEIEKVFGAKIQSSLDNLTASIASLGEEARELLNVIVQAGTEFSHSLNRVSAWFARSGSLPRDPFKVDVAIEAAVRITNNCFPGREISISIEGGAHESLPGDWLNPVVDLFCNCFQNAVEHGGFRCPQTIGVFLCVNEGSLTIKMSNNLSDNVDAIVVSDRIRTSLADAKAGHHHRATEEKGSGFSKIMRIMRFDLPYGSFDIAVMNGNQVLSTITLPIGSSR